MKEHQDAFTQKKSDMEKRINELKDKNVKDREKYKDEESDRNNNARRFERDLRDKIREYDEKVRELMQDIGETKEAKDKEHLRLTDLQQRFEKKDEEDACKQREDSIKKAREKDADRREARRTEMAARVQAYWRGILTREQFDKMKKAKKKGKKRGGKKKK